MRGLGLPETLRAALDERLSSTGRRQRNTYIVPTLLGGAFLLCNVVLFLMAAVYRNDILYVHGFALLSLFFLAMIQTHGNLRALVLKGLPLSDPFAGEGFTWSLELDNPKKAGASALVVRALVLRTKEVGRGKNAPQATQDSPLARVLVGAPVEVVFVPGHARERFELTFTALERGLLGEIKVVVATRFPFGLFHAWRFFSLDSPRCCVLPRAAGSLPLPQLSADDGEALEGKGALSAAAAARALASAMAHGAADPDDLRAFRAGDATARILWRLYRPGRAPLVRSHGESAARPLFLTDEAVATLGSVEARVSQLSAWLLACRAHARPCAVRLHGFERDRMVDADFEAALRALACYPKENEH